MLAEEAEMPDTLRSFVLFALALSAGCADGSPVAPVASRLVPAVSAQAARNTAAVVRPAGGTCVTQVEVLSAEFPILSLHITGDCTLKHLGRATVDATQTVHLITGVITNNNTYTAADGDLLHAPFTGVATFNPDGSVSFTGSEVYAGGTGRFGNASGSSAVRGTATLATGEFRASGSIAY
jgi:hypothetical protein